VKIVTFIENLKKINIIYHENLTIVGKLMM